MSRLTSLQFNAVDRGSATINAVYDLQWRLGTRLLCKGSRDLLASHFINSWKRTGLKNRNVFTIKNLKHSIHHDISGNLEHDLKFLIKFYVLLKFVSETTISFSELKSYECK